MLRMGQLARAFLAVALSAGWVRPCASNAAVGRPILSESIHAIIEAKGVDQAESTYRQYRQQAFADVRESQSDTNALGYRLLREGKSDAAVRVFLLNAETYPASANVFNSLGEAYLATGQRSLAREAFTRELTLDPRSRGARYELARLDGRVLPTLPWLVLIHVWAGTLSILAGGMAMMAPKGKSTHRLAGKLFVGAMFAMTLSAVVRAAQHYDAESLNFWMALVTLYLVATGWRAARLRRASPGALDRLAPLTALFVGAGLLSVALEGGAFAGPAYVFSAVAMLSALGDWRWLRLSAYSANSRVVRHLWRTGLALFVAVGSLFLGQPQVFPYEVRNSGVLMLPGLLLLLSLAYWVARYRLARRKTHSGPESIRDAAVRTGQITQPTTLRTRA